MKTLVVFLLVCSAAFAQLDKEKAIEQLMALQTKVLQIAKRHQPAPFEHNTLILKKEVEQEIEALKLASLPSEQLYRLAIFCSLYAYPQMVDDLSWDLIFEEVCWRCVKIIASRSGEENADYLKRMKALFGTDGGPSLWFTEFIEAQAKL
jgi:hypothetical protein